VATIRRPRNRLKGPPQERQGLGAREHCSAGGREAVANGHRLGRDYDVHGKMPHQRSPKIIPCGVISVAADEYLRWCVYTDPLPPGIEPDRIPGLTIERLLVNREETIERSRFLTSKLEHCCRKICMMCFAAERSYEAEREFYSVTIREAPALFGMDAIDVSYHLEAFVYFARSSLDVAAAIFGLLLLDRSMDSFNDVTKKIVSSKRSGTAARLDANFVSWVASERADKHGWLPVLCGEERGRALRDKIAHQTGFPIHYEELFVESEKEYAVIRLSKDTKLPVKKFLDTVRDGVIENFIRFEEEIVRLYGEPGDQPKG
jgi:hypothetical protein